MMLSRFSRFRHIHSMESAYTLGVAISTVAGRLRIIWRSADASKTAATSLLMRAANSSSVPVKDSGEYS